MEEDEAWHGGCTLRSGIRRRCNWSNDLPPGTHCRICIGSGVEAIGWPWWKWMVKEMPRPCAARRSTAEGGDDVVLLGASSLDQQPLPSAQKVRIPSQGDEEGIRMIWWPLATMRRRSKVSKRVLLKYGASGVMLLQSVKWLVWGLVMGVEGDQGTNRKLRSSPFIWWQLNILIPMYLVLSKGVKLKLSPPAVEKGCAPDRRYWEVLIIIYKDNNLHQQDQRWD